MLRTLPLLAAVPLLVGAGLAEGLWTNRWTSSAELEAAASRLDNVPLDIGAWQGETLTLDDRQIARAGVRGSFLRRYVHRATGRSLTVLLVCGRPGPVAVHTPDVCYRGAGYALADPPVRAAPAPDALDPPPEFWSARFRKQGAAASEQLRILWAWTATGAWQAPANPRLAFAGCSFLYKVYLTHPVLGPEEPREHESTQTFLRSFLPEVNKALFPDS